MAHSHAPELLEVGCEAQSVLLPVGSFHRHDPAHPAARVFRVAGIARNQVDMQVHDRLTAASDPPSLPL
jgi:hypothetical protein